MQIVFRPSVESVKYQVKINTFNKHSNPNSSTIIYTIEVYRKNQTFKGPVINVKRSNVELNNPKNNSPIEEVFLISGEILHNLDLEVTEYGKIISIKNLKDIRKKWNSIRFKIEKTYLGQPVKNILDGIEKNINNEEELIISLSNDPFYFHFLKGVYTTYTNGRATFEGNINPLGSLNNFRIKKDTVLQTTEQGDHLITCEGEYPVTTLKEDAYSVFSNKTTHLISPKRFIKTINLEQELFVDDILTNSIIMDVQIKE